MPSAQRTFASDPRSVGDARTFLRSTLAGWRAEDLEYAAAQALTELTTNAVIHARTDFEVLVQWQDNVLRVCVHDGSLKPAVERSYAADATTGRGLRLVSSLCRSWGVEMSADGKTVWCELTLDWVSIDGEPDLDDFLALDDELAGRTDAVGSAQPMAMAA